jgi:RNA recognition motif-containing protein
MRRFTGRSKGFGFVEMTNDDEAQKAIDELNGATVQDVQLWLTNLSQNQKEKESFNNNSRGGDSRGGYGGGNSRGGETVVVETEEDINILYNYKKKGTI